MLKSYDRNNACGFLLNLVQNLTISVALPICAGSSIATTLSASDKTQRSERVKAIAIKTNLTPLEI